MTTFRTKGKFSYKYALVLQFSKSSLRKERLDSNSSTEQFCDVGKSQAREARALCLLPERGGLAAAWGPSNSNTAQLSANLQVCKEGTGKMFMQRK